MPHSPSLVRTLNNGVISVVYSSMSFSMEGAVGDFEVTVLPKWKANQVIGGLLGCQPGRSTGNG